MRKMVLCYHFRPPRDAELSALGDLGTNSTLYMTKVNSPNRLVWGSRIHSLVKPYHWATLEPLVALWQCDDAIQSHFDLLSQKMQSPTPRA